MNSTEQALFLALKALKQIHDMAKMKGYDSYTDNRIDEGIRETSANALKEIQSLNLP